MTDSAADVRARLVAFFERDLVGPAHGENEVLEERPSLRYSAGILFPRATLRDESSEVAGIADDPEPSTAQDAAEDAPALEDEEGEPVGNDVLEEDYDDTITLANTFKPSAIGLSFSCVQTAKLIVQVSASAYIPVPLDGQMRWRREALQLAPVTVDPATPGWQDFQLASGLRLRVVARRRADATALCTASLLNDTQERSAAAREFFQVAISLRSVTGDPCFREYRKLAVDNYDDEERGLAMLYRSRGVFAVGHGCAAEWTDVGDGRAAEVRTSVVPVVRVPPVVPVDSGEPWADMQFLAGDGADDDAILAALERLPGEYERWIADREVERAAFGSAFGDRPEEHLRLCRLAASRITAGVKLLKTDDHALRSFKLMNAAMLRQQRHARLRRRRDDPWIALPERYESVPGVSGYWRTFQIAFILMTIGGLVPDAPAQERELVDLIWFPTGGGKTEAYLAVAAFTLFRRRLANPEDGGCTILMRYTLRLLTSQQFQRAASLICACEQLRRSREDELGKEPFSIGLWVGKSLTPNDESDAISKLNKLARDDDAKNPFQLLACPWCGTELCDRRQLGYVHEGRRVVFRCPASRRSHGNAACPFSDPDTPLPVCVVDESIYARPPSLIIGTVDKFAMLAWRGEARSIFGRGRCSPPDLVIQDELHLISGPLGSMVGLYEGAIDLLCRSEARPNGPKIIASTATIRRASDQCKALFNRRTSLFPPQGLDASDNFFAREDKTADGRLYVGFLPTAASSPLTAQIRAVSALAQGLLLVAGAAKPGDLDPYWTLVQYFSSLKELGRAATLVAADIPEYLPSMQRRYGVPKEARRRLSWTEEMTSRKNEAEIPTILRDLECKYTGPVEGARRVQPPLDTLLATNMISVGVDVDRLGLMMVVTQPKSTSEYIQASSRVGRSRSAPGLVVTLYNAGRPRDRSHYEQFRSYHDAFYRFVEPTSVTPYAMPALERALHAVLVILARQVAGVAFPSEFDPNAPAFKAAVAFLRDRVRSVDAEQTDAFEAKLGRRLAEWTKLLPEDWGGFVKPERNFLMHPMGAPPPGAEFAGYSGYWETPTSMRNVDAECDGVVVAYPSDGASDGS